MNPMKRIQKSTKKQHRRISPFPGLNAVLQLSSPDQWTPCINHSQVDRQHIEKRIKRLERKASEKVKAGLKGLRLQNWLRPVI